MHRLLFIFGLIRVVFSFTIMHLTDLDRNKKSVNEGWSEINSKAIL